MGAIVTALVIPLVILNLLGGIGSGIWLAILGEWSPIWKGIAATIAGPFIFSLCMLPNLLLLAAAVYFYEKRFSPGYWFLTFVGSVYTYGLVTVWCVACLFLFLRHATPLTFLPLLIWSYGVGTGPWTYMAQKEQSQSGYNLAFFAQIGYVVLMLMVLFFQITIIDAVYAFGAIMLVGICFGMAENLAVTRARSALGA